MKKCCTFASAIDRDGGCKFFESNEPIKSSLKGKEPFNSKRLREQVNPPGKQNKIKVQQYTMKSLILAQDER